MVVYVISSTGKPLMPTNPCKARLLLKQGKAKCIRRYPFTIKLLYQTTEFTQELTCGVDTGSANIGVAVSNPKSEILYLSDIKIRNDITKRMDRRRAYRRDRRNRKTRYREVRWLNRGNSFKTDRFSPTMTSKFNAHIREIEFCKKILPITKLVLETATFDPHLLKSPEMNRYWGYQKGPNYGFGNTKAKVLDRDKYTCQSCKTKKTTLEVHHIIHRSQNGSDEEDNLITLCRNCHYDVHNNGLELKPKGKRKGNLKHATQMNSIRIQLLKHYPEAIETFGYITKENRLNLGLEKQHYYDACVIATGGDKIVLKSDPLYKIHVPRQDRRKSMGVRSERIIPTGKLFGFKKFDKVKYRGKEYFIKGRRTSGGFALNDMGLQWVRCGRLKKIGARKSCLVSYRAIENVGG